MKTESLNKQSVDPKWYVVDADGQILGRFASKLADRLRGKDKPTLLLILMEETSWWSSMQKK